MISGFSQLFVSSSCIGHYDENRLMLFYCGLFSSFTGIFWVLMGLIMKYGLPKPISNSVNSVAFGIIFVGIFVLLIGLICTTSQLIGGRVRNKTSALSSQQDLSKCSSPQTNGNLQTEVKVSVLP